MMVLTRFWYVILTIVAVLAISAALLATNLVNEQYERSARSDLVRDRYEVNLMLRIDARTRLDELAGVAADGDVREGLRRASARDRGAAIPDEVSEPLQERLTQLNTQMAGFRGDLLFAVDKDGWIVAAIAPGQMPESAGLGGFPLVERALMGYLRDDVWVYNGEVYRMAARPVVHGGQYVGALVHGMRFDEDFAARLAGLLDGASVGFFQGEDVFAGHMATGAPRSEDMAGPLAEVVEGEAFQGGEPSEVTPVPGGGLAIYALITGSARHRNVGFAIARPQRSLSSPAALILEHAGAEEWKALPWIYIGPAALVILLLGMFSFWLEHDRPLSKFLRATKDLLTTVENRLTITDFGGRYRQTASHVNDALDRAMEAAGALGPKRSAANLDQLLGPTASEPGSGSGSFFGFAEPGAGDGGGALDLPDVPPAGPAGRGPGTPAGGLPALGPSTLRPPGADAAPPVAPPRPAAPKPPAPPPVRKPAAPPPRTPATRPADKILDESDSLLDEPEEDRTSLELPKSRGALKSTLIGRAPPRPGVDDDEDDGPTMVARVPQELLQKSATDDEQAHFREVYQSFLDMKKKCGESTVGLTFEKFSVTLRKNRDTIVKRHGAARVRFTVYEKNGKAALKATPIK